MADPWWTVEVRPLGDETGKVRPLMRRAGPTRTALATLGALMVLAGCSGEEQPSSSTAATANPLGDGTVAPADPLAYVTFGLPAMPQCVALGHRFTLDLEAQPAEGKQWRVVAPPVTPIDQSVVVLGGTEFVGVPDDDVEIQRLTFAAASEAEVDIVVQYVDADGSPVPGAAEETWPITVTADGSCPPPPVTDTTIALEE